MVYVIVTSAAGAAVIASTHPRMPLTETTN
jgi:hypothetical protein